MPPEFLNSEEFINALLENPQLAFFGSLSNASLSPIQSQFFKNQGVGPSQDLFFGNIANLLSQGTSLTELPTFSEFMSNFDFAQQFNMLPPSLRPGSSIAKFAPPVQFLF